MKSITNSSILKSTIKLFTTGDKILVLLLLILGGTGFVGVNFTRHPGETCSIAINGKLTHHLELNKNKDLLVNGAIGECLIRIKDKKVRVIHSQCPQKICVKTGWISKSGEFIICVPNKIVIKIDGEKQDHFDVITQ